MEGTLLAEEGDARKHQNDDDAVITNDDEKSASSNRRQERSRGQSSLSFSIRKESFEGGPIPCVAFLSSRARDVDLCLYGQGPFLNRARIWRRKDKDVTTCTIGTSKPYLTRRRRARGEECVTDTSSPSQSPRTSPSPGATNTNTTATPSALKNLQQQPQQQPQQDRLLVFDRPGGNIHGIRHVECQQSYTSSEGKQSDKSNNNNNNNNRCNSYGYTIVFGDRKLAFVRGAAALADRIVVDDDDNDDDGADCRQTATPMMMMELLPVFQKKKRATTASSSSSRSNSSSTDNKRTASSSPQISTHYYYALSDWIWDVRTSQPTILQQQAGSSTSSQALEKDSNSMDSHILLLVGLAHNQVILLSASLKAPITSSSLPSSSSSPPIMVIQPLRKIQGATRCISYCMDIISNRTSMGHDDSATVAVGTVMNDILLWKVDLKSSSGTSSSSTDATTTTSCDTIIQHKYHQLKGHRGVLQAVRFNHSGSLLASASDDRSVRLWTRTNETDKYQWKEQWTAWGHTARCWDVAFCQDDDGDDDNRKDRTGGLVISTGEDGTARVWDIETGTALAVLRGHTTGVCLWSVDCFSMRREQHQDGILQRIAMTGANNGTIAFYNLDHYFCSSRNNKVESSLCESSSDNQTVTKTIVEQTEKQPEQTDSLLSSSSSTASPWPRQILIPDDRPQQPQSQQASGGTRDAIGANTNPVTSNGNDDKSTDVRGSEKKKSKKPKKKKVMQQIIVGMEYYAIKGAQRLSVDESSTSWVNASSTGLLVGTRSGSLMSLVVDKRNGALRSDDNARWIHHDGGWAKAASTHGVSVSDGCCMALHPSSSLVAVGTSCGDIVLTAINAALQGENASKHYDRQPSVLLKARELKSAQRLKWLDNGGLLSLHIRSARWWRIPSPLFPSDRDSDIAMTDGYDFSQYSVTFQLTTKKSVVACVALNSQRNRLVVGDTRGNLSVFDTSHVEREDSDAPLLPVSILHRAHKKEHVNDVLWTMDGRVLSVGNDGCVHESRVDLSTGNLVSLLSIPVAGYTGITDIWETTDGDIILAGYRGNELAILDYNTGYEFFRKDTGGRARAAAIDLGLRCDGPLSVIVCANERDGRNKLLLDIEDMGCSHQDPSGRQLSRSIGIGLHYESIYDACMFTFGSRNNTLALLTGSEDCSARISVWDRGQSQLIMSKLLPAQESGVRAVCSSRHDGNTAALMAVGGSKLLLQFFALTDGLHGDDSTVSVAFLGWGRSSEKPLIDQRINSVKATAIPFDRGTCKDEHDEYQHLVATGDSSGSIYLYKVSQAQKKSYTGILTFQSTRPILSLEFLRVDQVERDDLVLLLLVGTTAGTVHIIDVSSAISRTPPLQDFATEFPLSPLAGYQAHTMGVNAITARRMRLPPLDNGNGALVFQVCSGGDDQAVCCSTITVRLLNENDESKCVAAVTDLRKANEASVSALKGVYWIDESHFAFVGYSQRLELWRYEYQSSLERVASADSEVGDVCCLAACHDDENQSGDVVLAVGGAGVEFFSVSRSKMGNKD